MKSQIFIIFFIAINVHISYGQHRKDTLTTNSIKRLEQRVRNLESSELNEVKKAIDDLNKRISTEQTLNDQILNGISLQIESASYSLTVFGLLFAIGAIGLGVYVTYVERKVVRIGDESKVLLSKNQKIKEDIEEINRLIQSDIYNLFLKIKREETVHIINRLINIPKDVSNVCEILLSRELLQDDFPKLKQAYLNLKEEEDDEEYKDYYKLVFFQHFFNLTLRDEILRKEMLDSIPFVISAAFENDIVKSTFDFSTIMVDHGVPEFAKELNQFFNGLSSSKYKNFQEVYKVLFENLKSRKNRFDLWSVVPTIKTNRIAKINYGNLLKEKYQSETLTESEVLIFQELEQISALEQKERSEEKKKIEEQRLAKELRKENKKK